MNKSTIVVYLSDFKLVFIDQHANDIDFKEVKLPFNAKNIAQLAKTTQKDLYIACNNLQEDFKEFSKEFIVIEAAGGLIRNDQGEVLFIFRHNKWDLPKGKLEKKETPEKAAVRECQEECGLKDIELKDFLLNTYHIYEFKKGWALKKTHWYHMICNETNLVPQIEESITDIGWKKTIEIPSMLNNTYYNIIDVLDEAMLLDI